MKLSASFSLALLLGWALAQSNIATSEPGYLDFDNLPETNFSCEGKVIGGYYADVETGCQMFHVCTIGQKGEVTDIKFLCLNGTVFDQETRVCERIDEVDCSRSESFFGLNLELYGNHPAALGIAPEDVECEDECNSEQPGPEDYEDEEEVVSTTAAPTTTTATTTTTTTTTTSRPPTTTREPIGLQALLALHDAFTQSLNKPPPPRVINNAFSVKPERVYSTSVAPPPRFPSARPTYRPAKPTEYIHGYPRHHFPVTTHKPPDIRSNYHHFENGDTHFTHSFDSDKPYNFQFFRHSSTPSPFTVRIGVEPVARAAVSVVTSTSSSTSVRTSKVPPNRTQEEFPTGYEEYQDPELGEDPFFRDVPKISRPKRDAAHDTPPPGEPTEEKRHVKTEFLRHLLGSIDMVQEERQKLVRFFEKVEPEMEKEVKRMDVDRFLETLENKLGEMNLRSEEKETSTERPLGFEYDVGRVEGERLEENGTAGVEDWSIGSDLIGFRARREASEPAEERAQRRRSSLGRQSIDTERFTTDLEAGRRRAGNREPGRDPPPRGQRTRQRPRTELPPTESKREDVKPVTELIEDDVTTKEYRRSESRQSPETSRAKSPEPRRRRLRTRFDSYETTSERSSGGVNSGSSRLVGLRPGQNKFPEDLSTFRYRNLKRSGNETGKEERLVPVYETPETPPPTTTERRLPAAVGAGFEPRRRRVKVTPLPLPLAGTERDPAVEREPTGRREEGRPARPEESKRRGSLTRSSPRVTTTQEPPRTPDPLAGPPVEDPDFSCQGKVKGGFYADVASDCLGFFICSQGEINGPLLKSHFWCGATTKFNQRSRTCQADYLVECSVSDRYYHLNNDFLVPESEDELRGDFEPSKVR